MALDDAAHARLERAERDIARLERRQDKQADQFEQLRADLRTDLRDTEQRLGQRITDSHDEVIRTVQSVDEHLSSQDKLILTQFQREHQHILSRLDWPSGRRLIYSAAAATAAVAFSHFIAHWF